MKGNVRLIPSYLSAPTTSSCSAKEQEVTLPNGSYKKPSHIMASRCAEGTRGEGSHEGPPSLQLRERQRVPSPAACPSIPHVWQAEPRALGPRTDPHHSVLLFNTELPTSLPGASPHLQREHFLLLSSFHSLIYHPRKQACMAFSFKRFYFLQNTEK